MAFLREAFSKQKTQFINMEQVEVSEQKQEKHFSLTSFSLEIWCFKNVIWILLFPHVIYHIFIWQLQTYCCMSSYDASYVFIR